MPKKVDASERCQTIASAAIAVIDEGGLDNLRLRDVARAAAVTTGAVTHYFDGKDAVLEAALAEIVRRTLERMATRHDLAAPGDVDGFLARVSAYLPTGDEGRREWRVWIAFWGRAIAEPRLRDIHRQYYREIALRMAELLQALAALGPPSAERARRCADAVIAAIDGVGTRATLEPELWPAERQRQTLRDLLRPALAAFVHEPPEEVGR